MSSHPGVREVRPAGPLSGEVRVPGDKSVSHRALLFGALARGTTRVTGLLDSEDVHATREAVRALGVTVRHEADGSVSVVPPEGGLRAPVAAIDCGNSGTTMRLLAGLLAGAGLPATLVGDPSLSRRPMRRIAEPLREMGVPVQTSADGTPPVVLGAGEVRPGVRHDLKVASAQVKSCLLLAGLRVGVSVREPERSRDHSERLLRAMGATLREDALGLHLEPVASLRGLEIQVPGDLSAAAFWLVGGAIVPGSELILRGVGINPTRAGVLDALAAMGAAIEVRPVPSQGGEPIADLVVRHGALSGTEIRGELALRCLDEIPVLAVAAAFARGVTTIRDASELRVKESDRIARVVAGLRALGVVVDELPDGLVVHGGHPVGPASVDASGDHRIAMAFAMAGAACAGGVSIAASDSVGSSYPAFFDQLAEARVGAPRHTIG